MDAEHTNGWTENRKLVLSELASIRLELRDLAAQQTRIREDLAGLKALAGFIGGLAGALSSLIGRLF